jgi:hypothetical protein
MARAVAPRPRPARCPDAHPRRRQRRAPAAPVCGRGNDTTAADDTFQDVGEVYRISLERTFIPARGRQSSLPAQGRHSLQERVGFDGFGADLQQRAQVAGSKQRPDGIEIARDQVDVAANRGQAHAACPGEARDQPDTEVEQRRGRVDRQQVGTAGLCRGKGQRPACGHLEDVADRLETRLRAGDPDVAAARDTPEDRQVASRVRRLGIATERRDQQPRNADNTDSGPVGRRRGDGANPDDAASARLVLHQNVGAETVLQERLNEPGFRVESATRCPRHDPADPPSGQRRAHPIPGLSAAAGEGSGSGCPTQHLECLSARQPHRPSWRQAPASQLENCSHQSMATAGSCSRYRE